MLITILATPFHFGEIVQDVRKVVNLFEVALNDSLSKHLEYRLIHKFHSVHMLQNSYLLVISVVLVKLVLCII